MERAKITVFDTTLRDGEQSPGCSMNVPEKMRLARQLEKLGVDVIEAGFPIASDGDFTAVQKIAAEVRTPIICGLARSVPLDIERAWQALQGAARPRIHVFLATSDIHLQFKLKMTREKCLQQVREGVRLAKSRCFDVEFSAEDATRTDIDFLVEVFNAAAEEGATTLNAPDTVGFTVPTDMGQIIRALCQRVKGVAEGRVVISTHCHNDLGLAVANSLAAVAAGARQVECAMNGIGERAGNAALEEVVVALRVRPDQYPYETSVVSEQLYPTSQMLCETIGVPVQPNKAIIGRNAFAHAAGIHQDGMIKNPLTYEIITPQSVGVPDSTLVLGKHSGRHALSQRYEKLGHQFDRWQLDDIYRRFVLLADRIKRVEDHHLLELAREAGHPPKADAVAAAEAMQKKLAASVPIAATRNQHHDHHGEQEDYLWGV